MTAPAPARPAAVGWWRPPRDWRDDAACHQPGQDPGAWVLEGENLTPANVEAKRVCREECPVRRACQWVTERTPPDRRRGLILAGQEYGTHGRPRKTRGRPAGGGPTRPPAD